jgi:Tol biopolymer transport system component
MLPASRVLLTTLIALPLFAQYFGQNKVRYRTLEFQVLKTEHFDIYYYNDMKEVIGDIARMSERWYGRLSKVLNHQLSSRQPLILYASHPDFRGTTAIPGYIGETTGGVTEGLRRRMVLPLAGPIADTDHVLGHELVHAFQFDITSRRGPEGGTGLPGTLRLPLWFIEGMAEYLSLGPLHSHTAMWMRDAVRREAVPTIGDLNSPKYFPYRYGHAFWAFVAGRYGDEVIGRMLAAAGRAGSAEGAIQGVLKISTKELSHQWREALLDDYEPVLQRTVPVRQQSRLLLSEEEGGGALNVSPVLSPDGKRVVFFSEKDLFSIDLFIADADTGEIRRKITSTAVDPHFDSFQFVNSSGAWSADGRKLAFGSIRSGRAAISIYDVEEDEITERLASDDIGEIYNPSWSPDGRFIVFSANAGGVTDLFVAEVATGSLRRLTNDPFADLHPAWSPDGTRIAFVTDRFTSDTSRLAFTGSRLAIIDAVSGDIRPVTAFDSGKHINPQWAPDGNGLYFISDRDGIPNIYRVSLARGGITQITNLETGAAGISEISPAYSVAVGTGRVAFSAFLDGDYDVFVIEPEAAAKGMPLNMALAGLSPAMLPPAKRPLGVVAAMLNSPGLGLPAPQNLPVEDYDPSLSLDYIAPPQISVGMSNFGSFLGGGTAFYFSDLLGYHNVMTAFQTSTVGDAGNFLRNVSAIGAYQNQKSRWTWGFLGGQVPFLSGAYGATRGNVGGEPAIIENSTTYWQINRQAAGILAYPFNRAQRIEFSSGYQNTSFAGEQRLQAFSALTGQFLGEQVEDLDAPESLHMGTGNAALVFDTSLFGGTSPVAGQRYRLEGGVAAGTLDYTTVLVDYRRYLRIARPLTLAGRFLHFGRHGGGAGDRRLQDLFIGYPALIRGYDPNSFTIEDCGSTVQTTGTCPAFDQLLGSRMAVANLELRIPILGFLGVIPSRGFPPVEIAPFFDAGVWTSAEKAWFLDGPRNPVTSYGASLRFNILGFAIGQLSYVRPNDRPRQNWMWQFSLLPGF